MGFDIKSIMNAATAGAAAETADRDFEEIRIDYEKIIVTKHNKYSMDEIEELAAGIEMAGGLHEPLILGRVNGEYWLANSIVPVNRRKIRSTVRGRNTRADAGRDRSTGAAKKH